MKPDEPNNSQSGMSLSQQGPTSDAAAQIIRSQINNLYDNQNIKNESNMASDNRPTPLEDVNPYHRTHSENLELQTNDWKHYHTAWQNYYQKYYEGYYKHNPQKTNPELTDKVFSTDEAVFDLKQELLGKVHKSAIKVKKSRHFIPIISGLIVVLFFVFLQYNRLVISNVMAYVSPGNIDPQNIVINPNADLLVGPESRLIVPKINIDVPVMYDIGNDYDSQMAAMSKGVAHFAVPGASSHPGQIGNTVIAGHSSNDLLDNGDYKFIFAQLDKLNVGDTIYANYQSIRYTYTVTKKEVVKPSEVNKLVYPTSKPVLTLLTCTPLGTALNRLLVTAEQISPDPSKSNAAPVNNSSTTKSIPGNSPTFFERLFGAR